MTWAIETVDSSGNVGNPPSIAIVNSQPAIGYCDTTNSSLKYARWNGSSWDIETVEATGANFFRLSLFEIGGQPAIAYNGAANVDLKYARWNGSSWAIETVESSVSDGTQFDLSLAQVNSQPAIAYFHGTSFDLKYARWNGSSWDIETVDSTGTVGQSASLTVVNGQPAISYFDTTNSSLKYARWNGSSWDIETVQTSTNTNTSLASFSNNPFIAYRPAAGIRLAQWNGSSWDVNVVEASGNLTAPSLASINGQPAISYHENDSDDLKYARWNGSSWDIETVDSTGNVGATNSLTEFDGSAAIAYYDTTNGDLKYAYLQLPPDAIDDLTATTITDTIIRADWTEPDSQEAITGYKVEINDGTGWTTHTADTGTTATSFFITGLVYATAYDVRVSAISSVGTGDASNTASATTLNAPIPWPSLETNYAGMNTGFDLLQSLMGNDPEAWAGLNRHRADPTKFRSTPWIAAAWPFDDLNSQFNLLHALMGQDPWAWSMVGSRSEATQTSSLLAIMLAHGLYVGSRT